MNKRIQTETKQPQERAAQEGEPKDVAGGVKKAAWVGAYPEAQRRRRTWLQQWQEQQQEEETQSVAVAVFVWLSSLPLSAKLSRRGEKERQSFIGREWG